MDRISFVLDDTIKDFLDKYGKIPECADRGHPYSERVVNGYQPGRDVHVQCTNCNGFYERRPTGNEVKSYSDMLKLEVRALAA